MIKQDTCNNGYGPSASTIHRQASRANMWCFRVLASIAITPTATALIDTWCLSRF